MAQLVGRGTYIMLGTEVTYGTVVSRTVALRVLSAGLQRTQQLMRSEELVGAAGSNGRRFRMQGNIEAGGPVSMYLFYEGAGLLWQHLMRTTVTTQADTPSSGLHTHTLHLGSTYSSFSLEQVKGASVQGGTTYAETFEGSVVSEWSISCALGEVAKLDTTWIAETTTDPDDTPTSPTFTSNYYPVMCHQIVAAWNSTTYKMRSFRVGVNLGVERVPTLGSKVTSQPVQANPPDVVFEAEFLATDWSLITAQHAATESSLVLSVIGTNSTAMTITLRVVAWETAENTQDSNGIQYVRVRGYALGSSSASTPELTVAIVNTQATFTAV